MMQFMFHWSKSVGVCAATALLLLGCSSTIPEKKAEPVALETGQTAKAPPLDPQAVAEFEIGLQAMRNGNDKQAEKTFRTLTQAHSQYSGPFVNLGILLHKQGDMEGAENAFKQALAINGQDAEIYNQLAILYRDQGHFELARETYENGLNRDPNYANILINLGILHDIYLNQPEKALQYYLRYQELVPDDRQVQLWTSDLQRRVTTTN